MRKSAIAIDTGTAMISAITDTTKVPKINASAPNCPSLGTQSRLVTKPSPSSRKAGQASRAVLSRIRARIASTSRPAPTHRALKARSARAAPPR